MKTIETKRLILGQWEEKDSGELYWLAKNPNVGPPAGWKPHDNLEESLRIIRTVLLPSSVWKISEKATGRIVGAIALEPDKIRPDIASREMGYWIGEAFWGMGYVTEAAERVIRFGFEEMNLQIISIATGPLNERSQRVIGKLGFTYEGTHRYCYKIYDGSVRDSLYFSMLREEWARKAL